MCVGVHAHVCVCVCVQGNMNKWILLLTAEAAGRIAIVWRLKQSSAVSVLPTLNAHVLFTRQCERHIVHTILGREGGRGREEGREREGGRWEGEREGRKVGGRGLEILFCA